MAASQNPVFDLPQDVELIRDVQYGSGGGRPLRMHVLRQRCLIAAPRPAVVWVHGGAFRHGSRDSGIARLAGLAAVGYFGASIEYRLSGEAEFPAQIEDCKCAIRYLRSHAEEWGIDPDRIGAWGESAGGHLVAMLGTSGGVPDLEGTGGWAGFPSGVQAVCDWFGPTDFLRMDSAGSKQVHDAADSPESELIGGPIQENPDLVARANPMSYVRPGGPPFLIVHGDHDPLVPFNQSELLAASLNEAGCDVTFVRLVGAGHGGPAFQTAESLARVREFFDTHLRAPSAG